MKPRVRVGLLVVAAIAVAMTNPDSAGSSAHSQVPQAPARDTIKPRTGTSRIRGRVLAADTSTPVRRAIVRLSSQELPQGRSKMTDADGKYEFADLPSGTYSLYASKNGFISGQPGATQIGDPGKTVTVGEAELATADDIVLRRACAIAGRVVDEFGDPVVSAQVSVLRSQSLGGVRRLMPASGSSTNDLGQFRAYGLQPGTYYVTARASTSDAETDDRTGYAPTYYPGTTRAADAQSVQLAAGQDATGVEIMLGTTRVARISGVALDSGGRPAASSGVSATLVEPGVGYGGPGSYGRVLPDGTFVVNNVPPGDYLLELRLSTAMSPGAPGPGRTEYGQARVTVAGTDVTGLMIQAAPGATVSGQVVFDGTSAPKPAKMTVMATSPPSFGPVPTGPTGPPAQVAADGTFTLTGVFGDRMFRLGGQPAGWMVKAVYVNGRDVTDTPVTLEGREQITGVQIVLTDRVTHITGSVSDERGQPADTAYVLVLPDDPARIAIASRFQRTALVRPGTSLKIDGLPPGDYVALVFKSAPQGFDLYDPELLDYARKAGTKFALREAETRDLTLRLVEPPGK
jgi:hypothetical protein